MTKLIKVLTFVAIFNAGTGAGFYFANHFGKEEKQTVCKMSIEADTQRSVDFAASLSKGIADNPSIQPALAKKVKAILDGPPSIRKTVLLRYMERHARAHLTESHLAAGNTEAIDWSKVDWNEVLGIILKILILIIPLL